MTVRLLHSGFETWNWERLCGRSDLWLVFSQAGAPPHGGGVGGGAGCFVSERASEGCEAEAPVPGRQAY